MTEDILSIPSRPKRYERQSEFELGPISVPSILRMPRSKPIQHDKAKPHRAMIFPSFTHPWLSIPEAGSIYPSLDTGA